MTDTPLNDIQDNNQTQAQMTLSSAFEKVRHSTPIRFVKSVLMHPNVVGITALCLAYGVWHYAYPSAAQRGANLAWDAVEGTADFIARAARKLNP